MAFSRYVDAFLKVKIQQQDFIVNGRLLTGQFGLAVSTVGDLNRDGFQDFAVNLNEYLIFVVAANIWVELSVEIIAPMLFRLM